jgi:biopolymer transport protein ExbD
MKPLSLRARRSAHHSLNELNITPLLDLVFVLLVIFIITTPQLTNNLDFNLPSGKAPPSTGPKPKPATVYVDAQGGVFVNDEAVGFLLLSNRLQTLHAADPEVAVVVRGAEEAGYQEMVNVLDLLQQMGITKVGLATAPGPGGR